MIRDKKTKKVNKVGMEFLRQPNEKEYIGVVTSVVGDIKNKSFQLEVGKTVKMYQRQNNSKLSAGWKAAEYWLTCGEC